MAGVFERVKIAKSIAATRRQEHGSKTSLVSAAVLHTILCRCARPLGISCAIQQKISLK